MGKKSSSSKTEKPTPKKATSAKAVVSKRASATVKVKLKATTVEVKAAGEKVMKKYSKAIKNLADR